jgi:hypothetical protein
VLGIIALAFIICAAATVWVWLALKFGRDVMDKAEAGHKTEALRAAAVFVRAIRPSSGGLLATLAKILQRRP